MAIRHRPWTTKPFMGVPVSRGYLGNGVNACYMFNEGAGPPRDVISRNATAPTSVPVWVATPYGGGRKYAGSTPSYDSIAQNALSITGGASGTPFSHHFIFSPSQVTAAQWALFIAPTVSASTAPHGVLTGHTSGKITYYVNGVGYTDGSTVSANQWLHVVVTFSGNHFGTNNWTFYLNGVKESAVTSNISSAGSPTTLFLGSGFANGTGTTSVALCTLWQRELTASEVQTLYANPFAYMSARRGLWTSPASTWPFSAETSGSSADAGALASVRALGGNAAGAANTVATPARSRSFTGYTAGYTKSEAAPTRSRSFAAASLGASQASVTYTVNRGFSGVSFAPLSTNGALNSIRRFSSVTSGVSSTIATAARAKALAGYTAGYSQSTATPVRSQNLAATSSGASKTSATYAANRGFSGIAFAPSSTTGLLKVLRQFFSVTAGVSKTTAQASRSLSFQGLTVANSAGVTTLRKQQSLSGNISGASYSKAAFGLVFQIKSSTQGFASSQVVFRIALPPTIAQLVSLSGTYEKTISVPAVYDPQILVRGKI